MGEGPESVRLFWRCGDEGRNLSPGLGMLGRSLTSI